MIDPKKILRILPETETEKATRKFFGTMVKDIKRNWGRTETVKIKKKIHHNVSQLANPI